MGRWKLRLKGKMALITGAGGHVGRESALLFARERASVLAVDLDSEAGRMTVDRVNEQRGQSLFCPGECGLVRKLQEDARGG